MKKLIVLSFTAFLTFLPGKVAFAQTMPQQAAKYLHGRYILKGAGCAGFDFINTKTVLWYNEISCVEPDTLRIKWIDANSFLTIAKTQINKGCPPRVDCYKIVSNTGKQLVLKSIWTGWNDFKDQTLVFNQK